MTLPALILVDIQNDYFPSFPDSKMALPEMDAAAANAAELLAAARNSGAQVIHVKHVMPSDAAPFFHPGTPGAEHHALVTPQEGERVVEKPRPNSFVGTELENILRESETQELVICGAMSQMCIDATARAAVDLGFGVTVVEDACAAANVSFGGVSVPAEMVHASIMAPLASSYAKVVSTDACLTTM